MTVLAFCQSAIGFPKWWISSAYSQTLIDLCHVIDIFSFTKSSTYSSSTVEFAVKWLPPMLFIVIKLSRWQNRYVFQGFLENCTFNFNVAEWVASWLVVSGISSFCNQFSIAWLFFQCYEKEITILGMNWEAQWAKELSLFHQILRRAGIGPILSSLSSPRS
jgi:hypothetical protein